jgi:hypothetical protein
MLNVNDIFVRVQELLGKDQWGKYVTPMSLNNKFNWLPQRLTDYYLQDFEANKKISTNLSHTFKVAGSPEVPPISVDSFGRAILPDDFYYPSSQYTAQFLNKCGGHDELRNAVEWVDEATFTARNRKGSMLEPTAEYPMACYTTIFNPETGAYIPAVLVAPKSKTLYMTYIRRIATPVFAYVLDRTTVIYDPDNSVQLDFPETAFDDAVEMLVKDYARDIHSGEDFQAATMEMRNQAPQN